MSATRGWDELPTLTTERLELRKLREDDAEAVFEVFRDPEVMRYWSSTPMKDLDDALALILQTHDLAQSKTLYQWGIVPRSSGVVAGTCTLLRLDFDNQRGEIGFALGRKHWGRGIASEAVGRLIGLSFNELNLHRLEADVDPRNERSLRLLEKQGFQREGLLRERYHVGGETQDTVFLGLLRREWKAGAGSPNS